MSRDSSLPYLREVPVIPGRDLIPGRDVPEFPCHYRVEETEVTFRLPDSKRSEADRLSYMVCLARRVEDKGDSAVLLMPFGAVESVGVFSFGWTLIENDGRFLTHQCVVFLRDSAVPVGRSDQGVICVADRKDLSAWDGLSEDRSRARVA